MREQPFGHPRENLQANSRRVEHMLLGNEANIDESTPRILQGRCRSKNPEEALKYTLIGEHLYRRGFSFPLLRCLDIEEAEYIMREVHEGVCGSHIGGRALASKITRTGYY
ncbi:hypothetical protein CR513_05076, partial [Mucuna pruriens]